jgi:hypothetical protein
MPDTNRDLTAYLGRAASCTREVFVRENPHPFLVRLPDNVALDDDPWADDLSFTTHVEGLDDEDEEDDRPDHAAIVAPVLKREGGPFPDRIGIGRARNCDIVLRFSTVSKLHAQLRLAGTQPGTQWTIADMGSANGTSVNGVALAPRTITAVNIGARLRFGRVEVELLDSSTLFDRLRARIR